MKYMIAPGKSITSQKGVKSQYEEVSVKTFGSASIFEALIKQGAIIELEPRPDYQQVVSLRANKPEKPITGDRRLPSPAVAEVRKVEVIEPIKKKEIEEVEEVTEEKRKYERKKNLFESEEKKAED